MKEYQNRQSMARWVPLLAFLTFTRVHLYCIGVA
jgi:hypothetical protein